MRYYLCIDLKTFYASVECVERNLDPFKTDLVVADISRGKGTLCLAITPKMKSRGIKNRCRLYEVPKNIPLIIAKPRMKKYIDYSVSIYKIYLKYVSEEDIHVYSIDEAFLDVTSYIKLYKKNPKEIAMMIMNDIYKSTKITATCGIGTNMYLAKIALDIISKHVKSNIGFLNEELYKKTLWKHTPISDFWQIGLGIENRLHKMHIKNMFDLAHTDEKILYKEFGVNALLLIDHAWGRESCTIEDIKNYKPKSNSLSNGQILFRDYNYVEGRVILIEMIDNLVLNLISKKLYTDVIGFSIGYSHHEIEKLKFSKKLNNPTNSFEVIKKELLEEYDYRVNEKYLIRKISIHFSNLTSNRITQLDLFNTNELSNEVLLENAVNNLKIKYGKNSILRAVSYTSCGTQKERNNLIGGHNAE